MATSGGRARGSNGSAYTWDQIKEVQSLIERCMQHYMTQTEIIATLQVQADIDPSLTCLVWQKLEEQNSDFFLSYSACLRLKDQIVAFNYLVEQQTRLLQKLTLSLPPGVSVEATHGGAVGGLQLNNNNNNNNDWTTQEVPHPADQSPASKQQEQQVLEEEEQQQQQQQQDAIQMAQQPQQVGVPAGSWEDH